MLVVTCALTGWLTMTYGLVGVTVFDRDTVAVHPFGPQGARTICPFKVKVTRASMASVSWRTSSPMACSSNC